MAKKNFGGMMPGNMNNILKQAQKMQENMQKNTISHPVLSI